jgi:putative Mg2+ transporter-C (MgtC) family protein
VPPETDINVIINVFIISLLAGLLGYERESAGKAAGLRTHILVGIAAVLFIAIGRFIAVGFRSYGDHIRFDAANLLGAIVSGISFLAAGIIIFNRNQRDVSGLTTAAGIITTAAIGILVGLERYILAVGSTVIVFIVLRFVNAFEQKFFDNDKSQKEKE